MGDTDGTAPILAGTLDLLILKTLSAGAFHGYGIAQHIKRLSRDALKIEEGSLYPALQRMLIKGWVTAAWKTSPTKRRTRVYTLDKKRLGLVTENGWLVVVERDFSAYDALLLPLMATNI